MLPLKDTLPSRRFLLVTLTLVVANVAVWAAYQVPHGDASAMTLGYRPCELDSSCDGSGLPWGLNLLTSLFAHGSWAHIIGNMLFLVIFGDNVEALLGRVRFLGFYVLGGLAATALQSGVTFAFGGDGATEVPNIGASGAIAAVLGAYLLEFPRSRVLNLGRAGLLLYDPGARVPRHLVRRADLHRRAVADGAGRGGRRGVLRARRRLPLRPGARAGVRARPAARPAAACGLNDGRTLPITATSPCSLLG